MGWADWFKRGSAAPEVELAAAIGLPSGAAVAPAMADFRRQSWALGDLTGSSLLSLASIGAVADSYTAPQDVPWEVIDAMGYDPVIYLGERAVSSVALDPELYYVRHSDPRVVAEVEAWLMPIMAELVASILPAFSYGCAPVVLDYSSEDLRSLVDMGKGERVRTLRGGVHFARVHSVWPGDVGLGTDQAGRVASILHGGLSYEGREEDARGNPLARRAFLPVWDKRWGRVSGMSSRRRAYKPWHMASLLGLWHGRYLERSVDVPRIGYAPKGNITINGEEVPAMRVLTAALMSLKNGSACVIPSEHDADGNPLWKLDTLDLPDRSGVWTEALGYYDGKKLEACLMPPGIARGEDVLSSAKVADALMRDFVQGLADFAAASMTEMVRAVHRLNGGKKPYPVVIANDVPQARRKILLEILKATINSTQHLEDGRTYTLGELVHPELLDQLGITARTVEEAAHKQSEAPKAPGQPGRPRDASGEREARREDARTDEGEDATGAAGEGEA